MKALKKVFYTLIVLLASAAIACEKEGPVGPQGEQGEQGDQGPKGAKGDPGTANVIYSQWATLKFPIRDTIIDGSHLKVSEILAPKLTAAIFNSGFIMVYMKYSNTVYALPYISDAGAEPNEINFRSTVGKIFITRFAFDDGGDINIGGSLQFRYVLIPGGVKARSASFAPDITDYQALCEYHGIPE